MAAKTNAGTDKRAESEWIGGLVTMPPAAVGMPADHPYEPEILLWMSDAGPLLGATTARPGELLLTAARHLLEATRKPMSGEPRTPARVRVASQDLARVLSAALGDAIPVVCAPTPELDAVIARMRGRLGGSTATAQEAPTARLLADLTNLDALDRAPGPIDEAARLKVEKRLFAAFLSSPEAQSLARRDLVFPFLTDLASREQQVTIARLGAPELQKLLFEIVPRDLDVDASEAASIIEEGRALYAFLKREAALPRADECLAVLTDEASAELATALADPAKFSVPKRLQVEGRLAGYAVDTKAGLDAWMQHVKERTAAMVEGLPTTSRAPTREDPALAKARKDQRKAARKARKKNRG